MTEISAAQVKQFLETHPAARAAGQWNVREETADFAGQRFWTQSMRGEVCVVKRYDASAADAARREALGLRLVGGVGLAPTLLLADMSGEALGGPLVIYQQSPGTYLGERPFTEGEIEGWLFLMLSLHHLPPESVPMMSTMSPDASSWWQRNQTAWIACQAAYGDPEHRPLMEALKRLHAIVTARIEVHRTLWQGIRRRPCHGNLAPALLRAEGVRLTLDGWQDFGLGDPAIETGRAAVLAYLAGQLDAERLARFLASYGGGMRDVRDQTLQQRLEIFASVAPLGIALALLALLAREQDAPKEARQHWLGQVTLALTTLERNLGVAAGDPALLLAPLRR
ncbi:MAG: hypothetical protein OJF49_004704 [Ktedonobacterales bacterium]|jgi:hypothetical protein|nr:MAG: hypothetical protein OJF49_004704 [Ktedonobacterales bacterium]